MSAPMHSTLIIEKNSKTETVMYTKYHFGTITTENNRNYTSDGRFPIYNIIQYIRSRPQTFILVSLGNSGSLIFDS